MKHLLYLLIFVVLISCSRPTETTATISDSVPENSQTEVQGEDEVICCNPDLLEDAEADAVPTDTAQINTYAEAGAFSILPDTAWLNEAQKDEETYNVIVDDHVWYQYIADSVLQARGIKLLHGGITYKRYYKFKLASGRDFYLDMNKIRGAWGMILFNGKDIPKFYSSTDVAFDMDSIKVFKD